MSILELRATDCKHCYKCIRNCPVKAIRFSDHQAAILPDECILCGRCFVGCTQNAQRVRDDLPVARGLLREKRPVVASIAPSFVANYPGATIESMREALMALGFVDAQETAMGATLVTREYDRLVSEGRQGVIISSCCHTVNMLVEKYYPDALKYMAPVISPMQAHAQLIRRDIPNAKVVFIGPCISKKAEAEVYPVTVDCALTFEELDEWLAASAISIERSDERTVDAQGKTRRYPLAGGILGSMTRAREDFDYIEINGISRCLAALSDVVSGRLDNCFIEMNACAGGCVNGPAMSGDAGPVRSALSVERYAGDEDFSVRNLDGPGMTKRLTFNAPGAVKFGERAIEEVLRKIGKTRAEDELNCGSCGYETCRDKAAAVLCGKANLEMCLPYLMRKAQSFSDTIIRHTPNGIIVLDEQLNVQQINEAARKTLSVKGAEDALGLSIMCLMDPSVFLQVQQSGQPIYDARQYLAEYGRYVSLTVIRDEDNQLMICIMRDITAGETLRATRKELAQHTVAVADDVISKQMRTVQEIASLLGETAAETKIALTKLKESLADD